MLWDGLMGWKITKRNKSRHHKKHSFTGTGKTSSERKTLQSRVMELLPHFRLLAGGFAKQVWRRKFFIVDAIRLLAGGKVSTIGCGDQKNITFLQNHMFYNGLDNI